MEDCAPPMGATPEPQRSGEPGEKPQKAASIPHTIAIFCHRRNVRNLVQALEDEIKHADGALPLVVCWSGVTGVLHQGMIILSCEGEPPIAFAHNLSIDHEIFDYAVSDWVRNNDDQESDREKEEQNAQSQGSNKEGERQFA